MLEQISRKVTPEVDVNAYAASAHPTNGVDPKLLGTTLREIGKHPGTLVLVGWSDYAKHVINVFGDDGSVLAIADDARAPKGWRYRSVPVVGVDEALALEPDHFVLTNIDDRIRAMAEVASHPKYRRQPVHCFPSPYSNEGRFYDPWRHSAFYRGLRGQDGQAGPQSMLDEGRMQFLVECLRQSLYLDGDVLEVGSWQGGSAWPIARLLSSLGLSKRLVMLDFFEALPRKFAEGIMHEEEIREWLSFYPHVEVHAGNVDQNYRPMVEGTWCFVHYDAGFNANRLARSFGRLQPGGLMVLDNYGNVAANPRMFDRWFEARGHRVSTVPHSGQGWVVKHPSEPQPQGENRAQEHHSSNELLQEARLQEAAGQTRAANERAQKANERAQAAAEQARAAGERLQEANRQVQRLRREMREMRVSRGWKVASAVNAATSRASSIFRRG